MYMNSEGMAVKEAYQWKAKAQWKGPLLECAITIEIGLLSAGETLGSHTCQ